MSPASALTLGAVAVAWTAPYVLTPVTRHARDPFAVLCAWLATLAAVVVALAAGAVLLVVPPPEPAGALGRLLRHCWTIMHHHGPGFPVPGHEGHGWIGPLHDWHAGLEAVLGTVGVGTLLTLGIRLGFGVVRRRRAQGRVRDLHDDLRTLLGTEERTGRPGPVLWMPHDAPLAYSIGGRHGLVVASEGVRRMPAAQVAAILRHEAAHLRGRHHLIVAVVEALATALPWAPLTRRAPGTVRLLVELCADDSAARHCGSSAVRDALLALAGTPHPAHALPMGGGHLALRLDRLGGTVRRPSPVLRPVVVLCASVSPILVGALAWVILCGP